MTFTANFAGTAGTKLTALTPAFTLLAGTDDFEVDGSGAVRRTVAGTAQTFYATYNDARTSQTVTAASISSQNAGLMVLGSVSGGLVTGYFVRPQASPTTCRLWKVVGGTITQLAASSTVADLTNIEFSVSISGGNPTFTVKRGATTILTFTDTTSPITSGRSGLFSYNTGAVTAGTAWTGYADNSSNGPAVTLTIDERQAGFPFEALAAAPDIVWTGTKPSGVGTLERLVKLTDGTVISNWATTGMSAPTATTWQWTNTTLPMRTDGKEYLIEVQEQADPTNKVVQTNSWRPCIIIARNDQSLDVIMSTLGKPPSNGALTSVRANNHNVMYAVDSTNSATAIQIARLDDPANYGSGMMMVADEFARWADAAAFPQYPITFVDINVSGMPMTDWNNDLAYGNWSLLQFMTKMLTACGGRISILMRPVVVWSSGGAAGITAMNQIVANVTARLPNQPGGYTFPVWVRGAPRATRSAANVISLRDAVTTIARQGGRFRELCGPIIHMQLEGANQLHQATGDPATVNNSATAHRQGNQRLGFMTGLGGAALLQEALGLPITIQRFGPTWASAPRFTNATQNVIRAIYDRDTRQLDGVTTGIPQFWVSTDDRVTWVQCTARKTSARTYEVDHPTAGNWQGQTVWLSYCKDSPWGTGDDTTIAASLDKLVYDAADWGSGRELVAMTDEAQVLAAAASTTVEITATVAGGNTITRTITINP